MNALVKWCRKQWFLLGLFLAVGVGLLDSERWLGLANQTVPRISIVVSVMFLMALPLESHVILRTIRRPGPAFLAVAMTYGLMPLLAWPFLYVLSPESGSGLIVAAVTPCTLASAAVWTRRAGGNDATAILVTLISNASCFLVAPFWLWLILNAETESIDWPGMMVRLAGIVLLPILTAQFLRKSDSIAAWSSANKPLLAIIAQFGILAMVFLGSVKLGPQLRESDQAWSADFLVMAGGAIGLHLVVLYAGWKVARWLGMPRQERIAVGFAGSQKTLMIGLSLAMDLGVSVLPMVTFHAAQLILDTLIADRWASGGDRDQGGGA